MPGGVLLDANGKPLFTPAPATPAPHPDPAQHFADLAAAARDATAAKTTAPNARAGDPGFFDVLGDAGASLLPNESDLDAVGAKFTIGGHTFATPWGIAAAEIGGPAYRGVRGVVDPIAHAAMRGLDVKNPGTVGWDSPRASWDPLGQPTFLGYKDKPDPEGSTAAGDLAQSMLILNPEASWAGHSAPTGAPPAARLPSPLSMKGVPADIAHDLRVARLQGMVGDVELTGQEALDHSNGLTDHVMTDRQYLAKAKTASPGWANPEVAPSVQVSDVHSTKDANPDLMAVTQAHQLHPAMPAVSAVDPARGKEMADIYESLPVNDPAAKPAYDALNATIAKQYAALKDAGYSFDFTDENPYPNSKAMRADLRDNKHLSTFKTPTDNFHPYMTPEQNDQLRAVHDALTHGAGGYQFGAYGEEGAYRIHASTLPPEALPALATETRGQNSWVNFGPNSHLPVAERPFAPQKAALWPKEYLGDYADMPTTRAPLDTQVNDPARYDDLLKDGAPPAVPDVTQAPSPYNPNKTGAVDLSGSGKIPAKKGVTGGNRSGGLLDLGGVRPATPGETGAVVKGLGFGNGTDALFPTQGLLENNALKAYRPNAVQARLDEMYSKLDAAGPLKHSDEYHGVIAPDFTPDAGINTELLPARRGYTKRANTVHLDFINDPATHGIMSAQIERGREMTDWYASADAVHKSYAERGGDVPLFNSFTSGASASNPVEQELHGGTATVWALKNKLTTLDEMRALSALPADERGAAFDALAKKINEQAQTHLPGSKNLSVHGGHLQNGLARYDNAPAGRYKIPTYAGQRLGPEPGFTLDQHEGVGSTFASPVHELWAGNKDLGLPKRPFDPQEYGAVEPLYRKLAHEFQFSDRGTQAARWTGGAPLTGVLSPANKNFLQITEGMLMRDAAMRGEDPHQLWERIARGETYLADWPIAALREKGLAAPAKPRKVAGMRKR